MKPMKFLSSLFSALFMILSTTAAAPMAGLDPATVFYTGVGATAVVTVFAPQIKDASGFALYNTVYRQVWTGETLKAMKLLEMFTWVTAITKDYSRFVTPVGEENEVINLASFPARPDVLIDNTSYPIASQNLATDNINISLNKFQTKVTKITDDELYANSTQVVKNHTDAHAEAIMENKFAKGAWNICPTGNAAKTPVLVATGGNDGTGRKMLLWEDIVRYKRALDNAEISDRPGSRIMALDTNHQTDLASVDQKFRDQFYDFATGKPFNALGFSFYQNNLNPYYNFTSLAKQSLGVTPTNAMRRASMFFSTDRVGKAIGSTKIYLAPAATDPENQSARMNARHYHLITRLMNEGVGAIVSPDA